MVKVRLLGTLEVYDDLDVPVALPGAKLRALMAELALRPGQLVPADRLIEDLWGAEAKATTANSLQGLVSRLRRSLPAGMLVTRPPGYVLDVAVEAVDIGRFEQLGAEGRKALAEGDAPKAAALLREALGLWRGPALVEFVYDDFARPFIPRLEEERSAVLEDRVEAELACGRHAELVAELEEAVTAEPLRERLRGQLMLALYRSGRQADALRQLQLARRVLVDELGLEPGPELRRLEAAMLAHDPSLEGPPRSSPDDTLQAGNLPGTLTRFVGRRQELARLRELIGACRLVTLVGPGGAGKSRLALEAAIDRCHSLPHGAWLAELAPVADAEGVVPAIASALGVADLTERRRGTSAVSSLDALLSHLSGRSLLIVLDNCEHLIGAAAAVTETLLRSVPGLRVVATSREALGVPGEYVIPVGPLPLADALVLFSDRAQSAAAVEVTAEGVGLAEDVCRRLDGMPLAIELAAARLRALPLAQLAARLDDRFRVLTSGARTALPRHQTLRAVVDWSYDLLFEDEQRLFRRASALVGPFTLADAEAVCGDDDLDAAEILDLLLRLVEKSLVVTATSANEARFSQLQTLREYGRGRLFESGEADVIRSRHSSHYRQMAEDAHEGLRGATAPVWRERLNSELGNLRAALDWLVAAGDAQSAMSLASGMAWLWFLNGEWAEGTRWLGDALGALGPAQPETSATARAWHAYFRCMSQKPPAGVADCEGAAAALRSGTDPQALAEALLLCGSVLMRAQEFERALSYLAEAHGVLERLGHGWLLAVHDIILAFNLAPLGRLDEAEAAARSSLDAFDAQGEVFFSIDPMNILAGIAEARGDLDQAVVMHEAILERCRQTGQRNYVPYKLVHLAALLARQGDDAAADRLYNEAIASSHNRWLSAEAMVGQAGVARRLGDRRRAEALLDAASSHYDAIGVATGHAAVLAARTWWFLAAAEPAQALAAARAAVEASSPGSDKAILLAAQSALAAANAVGDPSREHTEAFLVLAERRAHGGLAFGTLTDEADVAALAARLQAPGY
jgi:predicted ATPase/DNA-binding SARP family transcriptional activator